MTHGSPFTYQNHGCRCAECRDAHTEYKRQRNRVLAERQARCSHSKWALHESRPKYGRPRLMCNECRKTKVAE